MPINPADRDLVREWGKKLSGPWPLKAVLTDDPRSPKLESFHRALAETVSSPDFIVERRPGREFPELVVGEVWRFHMVPSGRELEPFLEVISTMADPRPLPLHTLSRELEMPPWSSDLLLFVTPQCPFCPAAVRQIIPLTASPARSRARVVDGALFPEIAEQHGVKSVPTLILNGKFRLTGTITLDEILRILHRSDPSLLDTDTLLRMLKEGQAGLLAKMMGEKNMVFRGFLPLLVHPEWNVRLGAMVVVETLAEISPSLAGELLDTVWDSILRADSRVQGDFLHLVGQLGDSRWVSRMEDLARLNPDPEVREVFVETLELLRKRP